MQRRQGSQLMRVNTLASQVTNGNIFQHKSHSTVFGQFLSYCYNISCNHLSIINSSQLPLSAG